MADVLIAAAAEEDYTAALSWYAERSEQRHAGSRENSNTQFKRFNQTHNGFRSVIVYRFDLMRRYPFQVIYREASGRI